MKSLRNNEKGFTLIEIVIVLAIAAGIILVVLLAVGNAQRGNRDTKRVAAVAASASFIEQCAANNNGKVATCQPTLALVPAGAEPSTGAVPVTGAAGALAALSAAGIQITMGEKCGAAGAAVAGGNTQYAIQYYQEGGGGKAICKDNAS